MLAWFGGTDKGGKVGRALIAGGREAPAGQDRKVAELSRFRAPRPLTSSSPSKWSFSDLGSAAGQTCPFSRVILRDTLVSCNCQSCCIFHTCFMHFSMLLCAFVNVVTSTSQNCPFSQPGHPQTHPPDIRCIPRSTSQRSRHRDNERQEETKQLVTRCFHRPGFRVF